MKRPRIVIPEIFREVSNYTKAMNAAGLDPVVVSVQSIQAEKGHQKEYIDYLDINPRSYDGLLLPGGDDINPEAYGEENCGSIPAEKWIDCLQFRMLGDFIACGKPVFGICRGLQLINVWFGGSLIQDLPDADLHKYHPETGDQIHDSHADKGSWIADLYGESFVHNSSHHQAVDRLGNGLIADSRCPCDSVIESLHHESLPIYAVQWPPERLSLSFRRPGAVDGLEIFRFFFRLCGGVSGPDEPHRDHPFLRDGVVSDGLGL